MVSRLHQLPRMRRAVGSVEASGPFFVQYLQLCKIKSKRWLWIRHHCASVSITLTTLCVMCLNMLLGFIRNQYTRKHAFWTLLCHVHLDCFRYFAYLDLLSLLAWRSLLTVMHFQRSSTCLSSDLSGYPE